MDDCTSSEKNSISSSEKESLERLLHRTKKHTRHVVDDSADSEDEKVLFGSGEYKQNNQQ